jgi:hypothetical protein
LRKPGLSIGSNLALPGITGFADALSFGEPIEQMLLAKPLYSWIPAFAGMM